MYVHVVYIAGFHLMLVQTTPNMRHEVAVLSDAIYMHVHTHAHAHSPTVAGRYTVARAHPGSAPARVRAVGPVGPLRPAALAEGVGGRYRRHVRRHDVWVVARRRRDFIGRFGEF